MTTSVIAVHGFTDVDGQEDPDAWVAVLDKVGAEPFYAHVKQRVAALLRAVPAGRYLDAGAGTGAAALALARTGPTVVALDRSQAMAGAARRRGVRLVVRGDAHHLPFGDATFDGVWADRVLQHLTDPGGAVAELVRVTAPGGRVVLCDPDYDTQVLDIADQDLARRVLRYRADVLLRHGTYAHRTAGTLTALGLAEVGVEAHTMLVRDPTAVDNVLGLRTWTGALTPAEAVEFQRQFDASVAAGQFLYAVTFFVTSATVR